MKQNYDPGTQPLLKTDQHGPPRTLLPTPRCPITQHLLTAVPSLSLFINYKFNITNVVKAAIQNHESFQRCTGLLQGQLAVMQLLSGTDEMLGCGVRVCCHPKGGRHPFPHSASSSPEPRGNPRSPESRPGRWLYPWKPGRSYRSDPRSHTPAVLGWLLSSPSIWPQVGASVAATVRLRRECAQPQRLPAWITLEKQSEPTVPLTRDVLSRYQETATRYTKRRRERAAPEPDSDLPGVLEFSDQNFMQLWLRQAKGSKM